MFQSSPRISTIFSTILFIFCSNTYAAPVKDFYIQQALDRYFPVPEDARSIATGTSSDMNCYGSICTFLNPAGLGSMKNYEVSASLSTVKVNGNEFITDDSIEETEDRGYIIAAIPLGETIQNAPEYGTLSFAYSRYQGETNDTIASTPDGHTRTVAYGYNPNANLGLGYTFTFYDDQLNSQLADLHSHSRILHLFGTQYKFDENTKIGALFRLGLGQSDTEDYTRGSNGLSKPREYAGSIGVTKKYDKISPFFAIDYAHVESEGNLADVSPAVVIGSGENGDFYSIKTGLEYSQTENFLLRAGIRWYDVYDYEFERSDLSDLNGDLSGLGWSAGFGYIFSKTEDGEPGIRFDYGFDYLTTADGQWEHKITMTVPFSV